MSVSIIEAVKDENLMKPFLGDLKSWVKWSVALRVLHGLPISGPKAERLVKRATGREASTMPRDGFKTALFLCGRRSGKSRISAICGTYEAVLAGHQSKLSAGEIGLVAIMSPTKSQSQIVKNYIRSIFSLPLFESQLASETAEGFVLKDKTEIRCMAGNFKSARGFTLLAAIIDEAAFFGYEDSKVSDIELVRAVRPALVTVGGKLIAISSPYARKGWCFDTHKKNHGNPKGRTLVWQAPSRMMNPTLPQSVIDDAMAEDPAACRSEFLAEFRMDVGAFIDRAVVEGLVATGCQERLPRKGTEYFGFVDMSSGRMDSAAVAIAHLDDGKVILDCVKEYRPPFNPENAIALIVDELRRYGVRRITGDAFGGNFVSDGFTGHGVYYEKSDLPASGLYAEMLPRLCSSGITLLDNDRLVDQLSNLERHTRAGGRDLITHAPGAHDDIANSVAGVSYVTSKRPLIVG